MLNVGRYRLFACTNSLVRVTPVAGGDCIAAARALVSACSGGLCVPAHAGEVDEHTGLVADDPGIMARRHVEDIARPVFDFVAVLRPYRHAALEHDAQVFRLTALGPGD